ncbi:hypothetical protein SODALDRAFT_330840 [Sodiomyces alkalinus F11]|uniref:Uncharacterized protein n=1 Tax=Sodiomyces alkalinus (strain CBS 110278 / VKM F-3762 / F11) TaxID=1314773 RepID=A0A3N2Q2Y6_SODAK|nr:hypothetical protein SODALDRAFT_330840 [Sodiomyces alkalinus F11]ROT41131.1 hypothetical protein SODALDRAFT_330840 [Sodiomyces alkalinus F11]
MPAINAIVARDAAHQLAKRNWAAQEPGVVIVFCILGAVGIGILAVLLYKYISRKRAEKEARVSQRI